MDVSRMKSAFTRCVAWRTVRRQAVCSGPFGFLALLLDGGQHGQQQVVGRYDPSSTGSCPLAVHHYRFVAPYRFDVGDLQLVQFGHTHTGATGQKHYQSGVVSGQIVDFVIRVRPFDYDRGRVYYSSYRLHERLRRRASGLTLTRGIVSMEIWLGYMRRSVAAICSLYSGVSRLPLPVTSESNRQTGSAVNAAFVMGTSLRFNRFMCETIHSTVALDSRPGSNDDAAPISVNVLYLALVAIAETLYYNRVPVQKNKERERAKKTN